MITEHNIKSNNNYLNSVSNEAAVSCVHQKSDNKRYLTQVIMIKKRTVAQDLICYIVQDITRLGPFNPIRYCWGPFGPTPILKANISMMAVG